MSDVKFLQLFLNTVIEKVMERGMHMHGVFELPYPLGGIANMGSEWDPAKLNLMKISFAEGIGMFNFGAILDTSFGSLASSLELGWQQEATAPNKHDLNLMSLSSTTLKWCKLGDFVAYCFLRLQLSDNGTFVGVALHLVRQLGDWLAKHLPSIMRFRGTNEIPELKGLVRSLRTDPRSLMNPANSRKHKEASKILCMAYFAKLAQTMASAPSRTLCLVQDGWRGSGEAMELIYVYQPHLNIGGYCPFQVPLQRVG